MSWKTKKKDVKDEINEFVRPEEKKDERKHDLKNNCTWMTEARRYNEWKTKEEKCAKKSSGTFWVEEPNLIVGVFCLYPSHTECQDRTGRNGYGTR